MSQHLGFYNTSGTRTHVRFPFGTFAAAGGNIAPLSAFEAADLTIYRAADSAAVSATQRSSSSGITMTSPFDSLTGVHAIDIDLTDNTDSGFYASGYQYSVVLAPDTETIDGQTITGVVLATFEIGIPVVKLADTTHGGSTSTLTLERLIVASTTTNEPGVKISGNGSAAGLLSTGGATGAGIRGVGGATSGAGIKAEGTAGNSAALQLAGQGSAAGLQATGGATGPGIAATGGGTSGEGLICTTTSGDGIKSAPTAGHAMNLVANGTSKHGLLSTGGGAGTSDGINAAAGSGGVDIRGAITGNITGNLSGSAGSVSGAVGSVAGNVGGNVTGNVGGNVVGSVGSVTAGVTISGTLTTLDALAIRSGTAAGGGDSTITLDAGASAVDDQYQNQIVQIRSGTGAGQSAIVESYNGTSKVATIVGAWATNPDNTSVFTLYPFGSISATVSGTVSVDGASIRSAIGLGSANLDTQLAEIEGETDDIAAVKTQTDKLTFTVTNQIDANVIDWKGATAPAMTGDAYARLGAPAGASVSADIAAVQTSVSNINNLSALANLYAPSTLVRPASSSIVYPLTFVVKDVEGHLVDVDSNAVTLTATNAAGTDRSANLSSVTHAGTGEYTFTYTVSSAHAVEGLRFTAAGTVQSATRKAYANGEVADADSLTSLAAIQAKTDQLLFDGNSFVKADVEDWKAATAPAMSGDAYARLGAPAGASVSADILAVKTKTDSLTFTVSNQVDANIKDWNGAAVGSVPPDAIFIRSGTAQAGGASTITHDAGASAVTDFYKDDVVLLRSGTGAGQWGVISAYNGTSKVATVYTAWHTAPDNTTTFSILPGGTSASAIAAGILATNQLTLNFDSGFTTTAGTTWRGFASVSKWGTWLDVHAADPTATLALAVREHGAGSDLFTVSATTVGSDGRFQLSQSTPGFTADRVYVFKFTLVMNSVTYYFDHVLPVQG